MNEINPTLLSFSISPFYILIVRLAWHPSVLDFIQRVGDGETLIHSTSSRNILKSKFTEELYICNTEHMDMFNP